jgi:hypothetical protein
MDSRGLVVVGTTSGVSVSSRGVVTALSFDYRQDCVDTLVRQFTVLHLKITYPKGSALAIPINRLKKVGSGNNKKNLEALIHDQRLTV